MTEQDYLAPTEIIDYTHPLVVAFVEEHSADGVVPRQCAVDLYYAVRDLFRYDPYRIDLTIAGMRASSTVEKGYGWCVSKAVLLAACCRARNIPARLGFGDVRNHLTSERLKRSMRTDIFYWHGFTEIFIGDRWLKATPAFNVELCRKSGIHPLEFTGREDSIFHPFDLDGKRHMEYVHGRGSFADLPLAEIEKTFQRHYSTLLLKGKGRFEDEVSRPD